MLLISKETNLIKIPRSTKAVGEYSLKLTNVMTKNVVILEVQDTGTDYCFEFELSSSQINQIPYGENICWVMCDNEMIESLMVRKIKDFAADVVYGYEGDVTRYMVRITAGDNGYLLINGQPYETFSRNMPENTVVNAMAVPDIHYAFEQWSDGSTENPREITVTEPVTLASSYEVNEWVNVTISSGSDGSISVNGVVGDYSDSVPYGTVLTIEAIPDTGYDFIRWSDGNTDATRTITVTEPVTLTSVYEVQMFTVSIVSNNTSYGNVVVDGVTGDFSITTSYGTQIEVSTSPAIGYEFVEWSDGYSNPTRTIIVGSDISLTGIFAVESYAVNITAGTNGSVSVNGVVGDYSHNVAYGTQLTIQATPDTGYNFTAWSDGNSDVSRTITVTGNVTLSASFAVSMLAVSVTAGNNGSITVNGVSGDYSDSVAYGTQLTIQAIPDTGYDFTSWSDGDTVNPKIMTVTAPVTLSSSYQIQTFTVDISSQDTNRGNVVVNGNTGDYSGTVGYGSVIIISANPSSGYDFIRWSDGNTDATRTVTVTSNITLSALFAVGMCNVVISSGNNGSVSVDGMTGDYSRTVAYGTLLDLQATPDTGYDFTAWSDGNTNATRTITVTSDITLSASFAVSMLAVSVTAGNNGSVSVNGVVGNYSQTVAYGTQLTIQATPDTGYNFTAWSDGVSTNPRTITVTAPVTLASAYQIQSFTVAITSQDTNEGNVVVNGSTGDYSQTVNYGTTLTLSVSPAQHYNFVMWSDGYVSDTRTVTVTGNLTLSAMFAIDMYNVVVSAGSDGSVSVNGVTGNYSQTVAYGTQLTIVATPDTGYNFTSWSDGNTSTTRTITVSSDLTLAASFAIQTFTVSISAGSDGSVEVNGVSGDFYDTVNYGTVLTIEAVPDQDYYFTDWSDGNTDNPRTITVMSNITIVSAFTNVAPIVQTSNQIFYTTESDSPVNVQGDVYDSEDNVLTLVSNTYADGLGILEYDGDIYRTDAIFYEDSDLTSVVLPDTLYEVCGGMFARCSSLTDISFMEGSQLNSIGGDAFTETPITSIVLPDTVRDIDSYAFSECYDLGYIECLSPQFDNFYEGFNDIGHSNGVYKGNFFNLFNITNIMNPDNDEQGWIARNGWTYVPVGEGIIAQTTGGKFVPNGTAYDANGNAVSPQEEWFDWVNIVAYSYDTPVTELSDLCLNNTTLKKIWINMPDLSTCSGNCFSTPNLEYIFISNTSAPTISGNDKFNGVTINGTLDYPSGSDYSSWLSTSPSFLGYYGWNNISMNCDIAVKKSGYTATLHPEFLLDSNGNAVTVTSSSNDGTLHKWTLSGQVDRITMYIGSLPGWVTFGDGQGGEVVYWSHCPREIGSNQMRSMKISTDVFKDVSVIGGNVFYESEFNLRNELNVHFDNVSSLGGNAFRNCTGISGFSIEGTFTSIPQYSLGFSSYDKVVVSRSIDTVGDYAFGSTQELNFNCFRTSSNALTVSDNAFTNIGSGCTLKLPKTTWETLVSKYPYNVEYYTTFNYVTSDGQPIVSEYDEIDNIYVNGTGMCAMYDIWNSQFSGNTNLTALTYMYGMYEYGAFSGCTNLISADLTDVTYLGSEAFDGCSLTTVHIPASLTQIDYRPFRCSTMTSISVDPNNTVWNDGGGTGLYRTSDNACFWLLPNKQPVEGTQYFAGWMMSYSGRTMDLRVPTTLEGFGTPDDDNNCCIFEGTQVKNVLFDYNCDPSQWSGEIEYSEDVANTIFWVNTQYLSDCQDRWGDINWMALPETNQLIYRSESVQPITVVLDSNCQDEDGNQLVVDTHTFNDGIGVITFTNDVSNLGEWIDPNYPLMKSAVKTVIIPECTSGLMDNFMKGFDSVEYFNTEQVTTIGVSVFEGCTDLKWINFSQNIDTFGDRMCYGCTSLNTVIMPEYLTNTGKYTFTGCTSLERVETSSTLTLFNQYVFDGCTALKTITVPNSVLSITTHAFHNCTSLTSVDITNVTVIGESAFSGCTNLATVTHPNSLVSIYSEAFANCTSLTSFSYPNTLITIDNAAFKNCASLTYASIPSGIQTIGVNPYEGCSGLTSLSVGLGNSTYWSGTDVSNVNYSKTIIEKRIIGGSQQDVVISGCKDSVIRPEVEYIGEKAFYGLDSLTSINLGECVIEIMDEAFRNCSKLNSIDIRDKVSPTEPTLGTNVFTGVKNTGTLYGKTGRYYTNMMAALPNGWYLSQS